MARHAQSFTPSELSELTGVDAKRIRAYLRSNFTRNPEAKNTSWAVSTEVKNDVVDHFSKSKAAASTDEG